MTLLKLSFAFAGTRAVGGIINTIGRHLLRLGRLSEVTGGRLETIGGALMRIGATLKRIAFEIAALIMLVIKFGAATGQAFAEFEIALTRAAIATAKSREELENIMPALDAIEKKAIEVGRSTFFSMQEGTEGMLKLIRAGLDTAQVMENIDIITNLATVGMINLEEAGSIALKTMNAFALTTADLTRIADVLTLTSFNANATISDLGLSMKKVGPLAAQLGFSLEEVSATLGVLANAGLAATEGGTAMRNMMMRLLDPSTKAQESLQKIGISSFEITTGMLTMEDVLRRIKTALDDGTIAGGDLIAQFKQGLITMEEMEAQFAANAVGANDISNIFRARAAPAVLALVASLDEGETGFVALEDKMRGAAGTAEKAANIMKDTTSFQLKQLKNTILEVTIAFGQFFAPIIKEIFKFVDDNRGVIDNMGGAFRRIGKNVASFGQIFEPLKNILPVVVTMITILKKQFEIAFGGRTGELIKAFLKEMVAFFVNFVSLVGNALIMLAPFGTILAVLFRGIVTLLFPILTFLLKGINLSLKLANAILTVIGAASNLAILNTILGVWNKLGTNFNAVLDSILEKFEDIEKFSDKITGGIFEGAKSVGGFVSDLMPFQSGADFIARRNMAIRVHPKERVRIDNPFLGQDRIDGEGGGQKVLNVTYNVHLKEFDFRDFVEQTRREQMRLG
jgi:TP901 family phage tail tape measure protein